MYLSRCQSVLEGASFSKLCATLFRLPLPKRTPGLYYCTFNSHSSIPPPFPVVLYSPSVNPSRFLGKVFKFFAPPLPFLLFFFAYFSCSGRKKDTAHTTFPFLTRKYLYLLHFRCFLPVSGAFRGLCQCSKILTPVSDSAVTAAFRPLNSPHDNFRAFQAFRRRPYLNVLFLC